MKVISPIVDTINLVHKKLDGSEFVLTCILLFINLATIFWKFMSSIDLKYIRTSKYKKLCENYLCFLCMELRWKLMLNAKWYSCFSTGVLLFILWCKAKTVLLLLKLYVCLLNIQLAHLCTNISPYMTDRFSSQKLPFFN